MSRPNVTQHILSLAATLMCCTTITANAADVAVSGRIQPTTGECALDLMGNESIDYGEIAAHTLAPDRNGIALLRRKSLHTYVHCTRPVKIGLRFVDGQPGTAVDDDAIGDAIHGTAGVDSPSSINKNHLFGLGLDRDGHRIGALVYQVNDRPVISYVDANGNVVTYARANLLMKTESGWPWVGVPPITRQAIYSAALKRTAGTPDPVFSLGIQGRIYPAIDMRPGHLTLADDVNFQAKIVVEAVLL